MQEAGFACSTDEAAFRSLLQQSGAQINEQAVAEVLCLMAMTQPSSLPSNTDPRQFLSTVASGGAPSTGWHWKPVIDVIRASGPGLNWAEVAEQLDQPNFKISGQPGFVLLLSAYRHAAGEQLPVKAVVGRVWRNYAGQLSFLRLAVEAPPELFSFAGSQRKLPPVEGLHGGRSPVGTPNQAWLSLDLLHVLCIVVTDPSHVATVREMLNNPLNNCPEVGVQTACCPSGFRLMKARIHATP
jgi:CCR4-NOT transcription complex subunit 1